MNDAEAGSTPDVANDVVARLEAEGAFVDAAGFTIDPRKAREILAAHQLAEPERFVLLLVEAGHLLPNCTNIAFEIDRKTTRVFFEGVELRSEELKNCFDAMFVDVGDLDLESARRLRGRQRLALAINTMLGLPNARVEMVSTISAMGSVRAVFDAEGRARTQAWPSTSATSRLVVELEHAAISSRLAQQNLLRTFARHAKLPLTLDGRRIDEELLSAVEIRDATNQVVGQAGWSAAQAGRKSGRMAFVANGVIVEDCLYPQLPVGLLALLEGDDLQRDISQSKVQRDEVFHRRVEAVLASCGSFTQPTPRLGPAFTDYNFFITGVSFTVAGAFSCGLAFGLRQTMEDSVGIFALLGMCSIGAGLWKLLRAHRWRGIRMNGHAGLGIVHSSLIKTTKYTRDLWVGLWIERLGQEPYGTRFRTPVSDEFKPLEPGTRVYVRIDRDDPQRVVFDTGR